MTDLNGVSTFLAARCEIFKSRLLFSPSWPQRCVKLVAVGVAISASSLQYARADESAADAAHARALRMQVYVVSATRVEKSPWRYASIPGFEILTRASDDATYWWIDALRCGRFIEDNLLPADWQPSSAVPGTVIIDEANLAEVAKSLIRTQAVDFESPPDAVTWGQLSDRVNNWTNHFESFDNDTDAVEANVFGVDLNRPATFIGMERLSRCRPELPVWLMTGLVSQKSGAFRESFMPVNHFRGLNISHEVDGPGTLWVSLDETNRLIRELHKKKNIEIPMLDLGEIFSATRPEAAADPLWASEAALFVRWGLFGPARESPESYRAFLEFVRRARSEPVTEKLFSDCFGFGYAAMQHRLDIFLRGVLATPTSAQMEIPHESDEPDLKEATDDQIGRILGDWLRMEGENLRSQDPDSSERFLRSAGQMLERAYRNDNGLPPDVDPSPIVASNTKESPNSHLGPPMMIKPFVVSASKIHDAGLLAVYGLYEYDAGDSEKAREFLEAATRQGVMRPMAYLCLARLRYAAALAKPQGSGGKLSVRQIADVTGPLRTATEYLVPSNAYETLVDAWNHSDSTLPRSDVEEILRGVSLYPRDIPLAYNAALLCVRDGYTAEAERLIDSALVFTTHEVSRKYFVRLRAELASSPVNH